MLKAAFMAALSAAALFPVNLTAAETVPSLDAALRDEGVKLIPVLKARRYKNVGVLKFLVGNEGGKLRDNFGPLNRSLADRLELSLLLALKKGDDLGIIFRASDIVKETGNERATHLTKEGRAEFFGFDPSPFALPWNTKVKVQPDAFLTGEARLSPDLRYINGVIQVFDRKAPETLTELSRFKALIDFRTLTEAGVSFVGARAPWSETVPQDGKPATELLTENKVQPPITPTTKDSWNMAAANLLKAMRDLPLKVEILYNGKPMTLDKNLFGPPTESANALLRVDPPKENDKVSFRVANNGTEPYAVVLLINGKNSIFPEEGERAPNDYAKWVLKPGQSVEVRGFQLTNTTTAQFRVESEAESRQNEVNYGLNAGTFTLLVFREAKSAPEKKMIEKVTENRKKKEEPALISRGTGKLLGQIAASDPASFQMNLRDLAAGSESSLHTRGLVSAGSTGAKEVTNVVFPAFPVPLYSATIRYYDTKKK